MLTPQEIQDKKFEKAVFGGYDMGQIDQFLDVVLGDYTSLYKENATLKAKMRVLVDKIEEYRSVDEEMRKTLYTAQVTAKEIVERATSQAENLLTDARKEADQAIASMKLEIEDEEKRLQEAQSASASYISKIKEAMRRNIELMDTILETPQQELRKKPQPPKGRPAPRDDFEVVLPEGVMEPVAVPQPVVKPQRADEGERPRERPARAEPMAEEEELSVYVTFEEAPTGKIASLMAELEDAEERTPEREGHEETYMGVRLADVAERSDPSEMETRFFEVELGSGQGGATPPADEEEGDTAKIYGDTTFTPKPRFDFSDIRFGKDYDADGDEP